MLLGGREDFFIQMAVPEQDIGTAAPKDDATGAIEWQQGFTVCHACCHIFLLLMTWSQCHFKHEHIQKLQKSKTAALGGCNCQQECYLRQTISRRSA